MYDAVRDLGLVQAQRYPPYSRKGSIPVVRLSSQLLCNVDYAFAHIIKLRATPSNECLNIRYRLGEDSSLTALRERVSISIRPVHRHLLSLDSIRSSSGGDHRLDSVKPVLQVKARLRLVFLDGSVMHWGFQPSYPTCPEQEVCVNLWVLPRMLPARRNPYNERISRKPRGQYSTLHRAHHKCQQGN
jgi:hypothetical protein